MENLSTTLIIVRKTFYMTSADLPDAYYYSVPLAVVNQKYWFSLKNKFKFLCPPNGLTSALGIFIKPLKLVFSHFRKLGHEIMAYLDDSFTCRDSFNQCKAVVTDLVELFHRLGFKAKSEKSQLLKAAQIDHPGFIIDSWEMKVTLTANTRYYKREREIMK